jgi:hypothetical protein
MNGCDVLAHGGGGDLSPTTKLVLGALFWAVSAFQLFLFCCPPLRKKMYVGRARMRRPMTSVDAGFSGAFAGAFGYVWLAGANGWPHPEWGIFAVAGLFILLLVGGGLGLALEQLRRRHAGPLEPPGDQNE